MCPLTPDQMSPSVVEVVESSRSDQTLRPAVRQTQPELRRGGPCVDHLALIGVAAELVRERVRVTPLPPHHQQAVDCEQGVELETWTLGCQVKLVREMNDGVVFLGGHIIKYSLQLVLFISLHDVDEEIVRLEVNHGYMLHLVLPLDDTNNPT